MNGDAMKNKTIVFGSYRLQVESQILLNEDKEIRLPKRPFRILVFLIENRTRVVSRDELLDEFWDGHDVYDDALRKTIAAIRKALNDSQKPPRLIETHYGSGFRFIGAVEEIHQNGNGNQADLGLSFNEKPIIEPPARNARRSFPYILTAMAAASVLFFVSLGFYAYLPNSTVNFSAPVTSAAPAPPVRSMAILPLKNLTGDANNEYFSDGITESLITELSRVDELKIISRSSIFALKNAAEEDPREIGRRLGVDALLEGSLRKKGDSFSVNVRLISTRDGSVLWTSRDFERPAANAFELQDTISCNIAVELRTELCDPAKRNTTNADAYEAYLKGRFQWNKRNAEGIKKSIEFYEQAIGFDSGYALAYAGLSESYVQGIWHVPFDAREVLPKAEKAALRAVELDETLSEAHTALVNVYQLQWNWTAAERAIKRALELNPRSARAHHVQAFCFLTLGRNDEAVASIQRAKELDPLNLVVNNDEATLLFAAGRRDEAFAQWKKTLELDANFAMAYEHRSRVFYFLGDETAAVEDHLKALELGGTAKEKIAELRRISSNKGLKGIYQNDFNDYLARRKRGENISLVGLAICAALLRQKDEAFDFLEKAYLERSPELILLKPHLPFASLRSDARFAALLKRMNLPE